MAASAAAGISYELIHNALSYFAFSLDANPIEAESARASLRALCDVLAPLHFAVVVHRKPCTGNVEKFIVHNTHGRFKCTKNAEEAMRLSEHPETFEDVEICHTHAEQYFGFSKLFDDFDTRSLSKANLQVLLKYKLKSSHRYHRRTNNSDRSVFLHGERRVYLEGITTTDEATQAAGVSTGATLVPFFQLVQRPSFGYHPTAPRIGEIVCGVLGESPDAKKREFLCWTTVSPQFARLVQLLRYGSAHPSFAGMTESSIIQSLIFTDHPRHSLTFEPSASLGSPYVYALIALPLVFNKKLTQPLLWRSPIVHAGPYRMELQNFFMFFAPYVNVLNSQLGNPGPFSVIVPASVREAGLHSVRSGSQDDDEMSVTELANPQ